MLLLVILLCFGVIILITRSSLSLIVHWVNHSCLNLWRLENNGPILVFKFFSLIANSCNIWHILSPVQLTRIYQFIVPRLTFCSNFLIFLYNYIFIGRIFIESQASITLFWLLNISRIALGCSGLLALAVLEIIQFDLPDVRASYIGATACISSINCLLSLITFNDTNILTSICHQILNL